MDISLIFVLKNEEKIFVQQKNQEKDFYSELKYFPVPVSASDSSLTVSFVDTWMDERNYGGERVHEGCDIITSKDLPGVYPVVSISDGVVEKIGWLELGGYRIGIRTDSGLYLYYAHLESYAEGLREGDSVKAGDCIGFVGNSGYGEEGTTGMFVTHLHMGFYIPDDNGEVAINPYPYLVNLKEKQLTYRFQEP